MAAAGTAPAGRHSALSLACTFSHGFPLSLGKSIYCAKNWIAEHPCMESEIRPKSRLESSWQKLLSEKGTRTRSK